MKAAASEFIFNDSNVCLNPEIVFHTEQPKYRITLEVASFEGKWSYGYWFTINFGDYHGSVSGAGKGPYSLTFKSKDRAVVAAIACAKSWIESTAKDNDASLSIFKEFYHWADTRNQLTLF